MKKLLLILCCFNLLFTSFGETSDTSVNPVEFTVFLRGSYAVPPNNSTHTGSGWFTLEGNILNYGVGVDAAPTGAGLYGPAAPGQNGSLIFDWPSYMFFPPVPGVPTGPHSAIGYIGGYLLTPEQVQQVRAGLWYVSVFFPDGEIRGQVCPSLPGFDCDADGDGVLNQNDFCPNTFPGDVVDGSGCSIAELVPCNGPWRNHREYVKAVREQAFRFWKEGRISADERNAIVKRAEKSTCGEPLPRPVVPRL